MWYFSPVGADKRELVLWMYSIKIPIEKALYWKVLRLKKASFAFQNTVLGLPLRNLKEIPFILQGPQHSKFSLSLSATYIFFLIKIFIEILDSHAGVQNNTE